MEIKGISLIAVMLIISVSIWIKDALIDTTERNHKCLCQDVELVTSRSAEPVTRNGKLTSCYKSLLNARYKLFSTKYEHENAFSTIALQH